MFVNMSNNSLTNVVVAYRTAVASTVSRDKSIVLKINPINTIKIQKYYIYIYINKSSSSSSSVSNPTWSYYLFPSNEPTDDNVK